MWLYQQPKADVGCCQCMCRTASPEDTCINALMLADIAPYCKSAHASLLVSAAACAAHRITYEKLPVRGAAATKITLHRLSNLLDWKSAHEQRCSKASIDADSPCERQCRETDAAPPGGRIITRQTASNATSGQSSVLPPIRDRQSTSALSTALAAIPTCTDIRYGIFAVLPAKWSSEAAYLSCQSALRPSN